MTNIQIENNDVCAAVCDSDDCDDDDCAHDDDGEHTTMIAWLRCQRLLLVIDAYWASERGSETRMAWS